MVRIRWQTWGKKKKWVLYIRQCLASAFNHSAFHCLHTLGCIHLEAFRDWTPCPWKCFFFDWTLMHSGLITAWGDRANWVSPVYTGRPYSLLHKNEKTKTSRSCDDALQGPAKSTSSRVSSTVTPRLPKNKVRKTCSRDYNKRTQKKRILHNQNTFHYDLLRDLGRMERASSGCGF